MSGGILRGPGAVFAVGIAITVLLVALMLVLVRSRNRAEAYARRATLDLQQSERSLPQLAENVSVGICDMQPDGSVTWANSMLRSILGLPNDEPVANLGLRRIVEEDREAVRRAWQHMLDTGEASRLRLRLRRADGPIRWVEQRSVPILDEDDEIDRIVM
ncbi:MAG: PAS domain-containing protein [Egibacteraceae bacterium]